MNVNDNVKFAERNEHTCVIYTVVWHKINDRLRPIDWCVIESTRERKIIKLQCVFKFKSSELYILSETE